MFNTGLGFWAYSFLGLFTYTYAMSEITCLGLLANFSNHILVTNQAPMIKRFLTLLETPSLDVKYVTRDLVRRRQSKATVDGDL